MSDIENEPVTETPPPSPEKPPMTEHSKRVRSERQKAHWAKVQEIRRSSLEATKKARAEAYKAQRISSAKKKLAHWTDRLKKDLEDIGGDESTDDSDESDDVGSSQNITGTEIGVDDMIQQIVQGLRKTHISAPPPQQHVPITLSYV